jgi:8-oxo-dGTP pyrophosphatase MutT (NUDIX family)
VTDLTARLQRIFDEGHGREVDGLLSDAPFLDHTPRPAAVLIAVTDRAEPGAILTRRPQDMRDHPGQVAFPGGKIDDGEDAVEAALREANEELGIDPQQVRVIGSSDPYVTGTGFEITPVMAVVPADIAITPSPAEVESWFEVPLNILFAQDNYSTGRVRWKGMERTYYEMQWNDYRIWGVTAAIIANLSRRLALDELFHA